MKITSKTTNIDYSDPFELFKKISDNGNNVSLLMESRSLNQRYGRQTIIVPNPSIKIIGKENSFTIKALTKQGKEILKLFNEKDFNFANKISFSEDKIEGVVEKEENSNVSEEEQFNLKNISFVVKMILRKFENDDDYCGLYGAFSYDFAKNFYKINKKFKEITDDFVLFLPTQVHVFYDLEKRAEKHEFFFTKNIDEEKVCGFEFKKQKKEIKFDLDEKTYLENAQKIIDDINNGRAMQCVYSRKMEMTLQKHPFKSYEQLRELNPSPYSFYYNFGDNEILYGASPEVHIKIQKKENLREIEIRPIAGTIQRTNNAMGDAKARKQLMNDEKEIREHTMLVDLARHELYKLCTRESVNVTDLFTLEEYTNLYHLVSGVRGILSEKDAIDSLLVTLPAGTLSGAPKQEAMKMIEEYEGSKRGFYGGAIGVIAFNGTCNTGITIRSTHVKNNTSTLRSGGGVVALSTPLGELNESKLKSSKTLIVLEEEP
ncbi:MAG: anthranilate synthase component I family protein [archaeon]|jgi:anthranilate synthase